MEMCYWKEYCIEMAWKIPEVQQQYEEALASQGLRCQAEAADLRAISMSSAGVFDSDEQ